MNTQLQLPLDPVVATIQVEEPASWEIEAWVDGATEPNPGPGGYAVVIRDQRPGVGIVVERGCHEASTTNSRCELLAAILALRLTGTFPVKIYSDSQYVVNGASSWIWGWKNRNPPWKKVKNRDLWEELDHYQTIKAVSWNWIRGHCGNIGNERADYLSFELARGRKPDLFTGLITDYKIKL